MKLLLILLLQQFSQIVTTAPLAIKSAAAIGDSSETKAKLHRSSSTTAINDYGLKMAKSRSAESANTPAKTGFYIKYQLKEEQPIGTFVGNVAIDSQPQSDYSGLGSLAMSYDYRGSEERTIVDGHNSPVKTKDVGRAERRIVAAEGGRRRRREVENVLSNVRRSKRVLSSDPVEPLASKSLLSSPPQSDIYLTSSLSFNTSSSSSSSSLTTSFPSIPSTSLPLSSLSSSASSSSSSSSSSFLSSSSPSSPSLSSTPRFSSPPVSSLPVSLKRPSVNMSPSMSSSPFSNRRLVRSKLPAISDIKYRFVSDSVSLFALDPLTGVITTKRVIDRDSPDFCRQKPTCEVHMSVVTQPVKYLRIIKVIVDIIDVNDNPPRFKDGSFQLSIAESSSLGSTHSLPTAFDWDSPANGIARYELENIPGVSLSYAEPQSSHLQLKQLSIDSTYVFQPNSLLNGASDLSSFRGPESSSSFAAMPQVFEHPSYYHSQRENILLLMPFALQSNRKLDGSTEVRLIVQASLDRELVDRYRLRLVAHDRGGRSGHVELLIAIADSNDNKPIFDRPRYRASVSENSPAKTSLLTVRAADIDTGDNGAVSFFFSKQTLVQWPDLQKTFSLGEASGVLSLVGQLDHEQVPMYRLLVTARDNGKEPLSSEVSVIVYVTDENDNRPQLTANTLAVVAGCKSPQQSSRNCDDLKADAASLSITGGQLAGSDSAKEHGGDARERIEHTEIVDIFEDSPVGSFLAHISVHDSDSRDNGKVNCSLDTHEFSLIERYSSEYHLVTSVTLDREVVSHYYVTMSCQDWGVTPLTSHLRFLVRILDINDNAPVFSQPNFYVTVAENDTTYAHKSLLQLIAIDRDKAENARLIFRLAGFTTQNNHTDRLWFHQLDLPNLAASAPADTITRNPPAKDDDDQLSCVLNLFCIDKLNGTLFSGSKIFDYETASRYVVLAEAVDSGNPSLTGSATINIDVLDINDEPPRFKKQTFQFSVIENTPSRDCGTEIGQLSAVDRDSSRFNKFKYSLATSSPLAKNASLVSPSLTIQLTTNSSTPVPRFAKVSGSSWKEQNSVYVASDETERAEIERLFRLDSRLGSIFVCAELDREQKDVYEFDVLVEDTDRSDFRDLAKVKVTVLDQNDNKPQLKNFNTSGSLVFDVSDKIEAEEILLVLDSYDSDVGQNSEVTYSLKIKEDFGASDQRTDHTDCKDYTKVDARSGRITTTRNLSPLNGQACDLTLLISDRGIPQLSSEIKITFRVNDSIPYSRRSSHRGDRGGGDDDDDDGDGSLLTLNLSNSAGKSGGLSWAYLFLAIFLGLFLVFVCVVLVTIVASFFRKKKKLQQSGLFHHPHSHHNHHHHQQQQQQHGKQRQGTKKMKTDSDGNRKRKWTGRMRRGKSAKVGRIQSGCSSEDVFWNGLTDKIMTSDIEDVKFSVDLLEVDEEASRRIGCPTTGTSQPEVAVTCRNQRQQIAIDSRSGGVEVEEDKEIDSSERLSSDSCCDYLQQKPPATRVTAPTNLTKRLLAAPRQAAKSSQPLVRFLPAPPRPNRSDQPSNSYYWLSSHRDNQDRLAVKPTTIDSSRSSKQSVLKSIFRKPPAGDFHKNKLSGYQQQANIFEVDKNRFSGAATTGFSSACSANRLASSPVGLLQTSFTMPKRSTVVKNLRFCEDSNIDNIRSSGYVASAVSSKVSNISSIATIPSAPVSIVDYSRLQLPRDAADAESATVAQLTDAAPLEALSSKTTTL